ncbi:hypothetical protein ETU08_01850 [Apibacter muscae]|uniref:Uncharacterized protein n=1 Tax=Apibacter muscae TaxID=2509004 RepID=A0A563DJV4_9FLAO|nr:hypothetical protein [Apibacter muscae]TWP30528.1 hypothetical protein ETU09_00575 [Apibacter muscae]TWP31249.1 hypothetical protein ETU08_01850 [Apibacter muscae]
MRVVSIILLTLTTILSCNKKTDKSVNDSMVIDSLPIEFQHSEEAKKQIDSLNSWLYEDEVDKMGDSIYYAQLKSAENLNLDFPYENSYASLNIRNKQGKNDVIFSVTEGQIKGYVYDGGTARIRFDNEKPFNIGYVGSSDGSSEVIFLQTPNKIIDKLKKSKRMVIEVEFYNNGNKQIEFNTEGLVWKH